MKQVNNGEYIKRIQLVRERVHSFDEFPFHLPIIRTMDEVVLHPNVTFLVGENGMGKSTLLEAIAVAAGFNAEGGSLNFNFSTYDSHSSLDEYIRLIRGAKRPKDGFFLRAETFYNVATTIEQLDDGPGGGAIIDSFGGISLHEQSHGESFWATFMNRFRGKGIYLLDEPESALSPLRQLSMLSKMEQLVQDDSQFIIATHSPLLMAYPHAKILELTEEGIHETTLEQTEHYLIMKQFFDDKDRLLHHLFK